MMAKTVIAALEHSAPVFLTGAATHVGCVRTRNEDSFLARAEIGLWAVADGMGGHDAGDLASATVVDALKRVSRPQTAADLLVQCTRQLTRANSTLINISRERGATLGTTVAVLLVHREHFACVWAGDSRIYLVRNRAITLFSRDHTEAQELVAEGRLTEAEARTWPRRNVITRAIGARDEPELEINNGILHAGDVFVLCSDGLTNHVEDHEILTAAADKTPQQACDTLIGLTLSRGASDNVTAIAVRYQPGSASRRRGTWE
jgi:serine/threonine protein phosphatase PrpC